jgi:hypothetical protein
MDCFIFYFQPFEMSAALFMLNPSVSMKYFLTFSMFINTIIAMGSARHYHYVEAAEEGKVSVWNVFNLLCLYCCYPLAFMSGLEK